MNQEKGKNTMTKQMELGGTFTLPGTGFSLHRMGYGAMQLSLLLFRNNASGEMK